MAERYRSGATLQQIGDYYGITRERVRQILTRSFGITAKDGGQTARSNARRAAADDARNRRYLAKHGMSFDEYRRINDFGNGEPPSSTPAAQFRQQRNNSQYRNIPWRLTFGQWWRIWDESGKWSQRGRGHGYVMSRHGDAGAYELGNVRIIPGTQNTSEFIRRYWHEVRTGKRPPPKTKPSRYAGIGVGETRQFQVAGKLEVARGNASAFARERGWKFTTSTKGGVLTVTRKS